MTTPEESLRVANLAAFEIERQLGAAAVEAELERAKQANAERFLDEGWPA